MPLLPTPLHPRSPCTALRTFRTCPPPISSTRTRVRSTASRWPSPQPLATRPSTTSTRGNASATCQMTTPICLRRRYRQLWAMMRATATRVVDSGPSPSIVTVRPTISGRHGVRCFHWDHCFDICQMCVWDFLPSPLVPICGFIGAQNSRSHPTHSKVYFII